MAAAPLPEKGELALSIMYEIPFLHPRQAFTGTDRSVPFFLSTLYIRGGGVQSIQFREFHSELLPPYR